MGIEPAGHSVRQLMFATLPQTRKPIAPEIGGAHRRQRRRSSLIGKLRQFRGSLEPKALPHNTDGLSVTSIPEPSTWAMTMLGFNGLGSPAIARRRVGTRLFPSPDLRPQSDLSRDRREAVFHFSSVTLNGSASGRFTSTPAVAGQRSRRIASINLSATF
jgi:hypothetical protein